MPQYPGRKTKLEHRYALHSRSQPSRKKKKRDLLPIIFGNRQRRTKHIAGSYKPSEMTASEIFLIVVLMQYVLSDTERPNLDVTSSSSVLFCTTTPSITTLYLSYRLNPASSVSFTGSDVCALNHMFMQTETHIKICCNIRASEIKITTGLSKAD